MIVRASQAPTLIRQSLHTFAHPAASAVAQLKSYCELIAFIMTAAVRTKMICTNVLVVKILANSAM
jgi:hypothetical protein